MFGGMGGAGGNERPGIGMLGSVSPGTVGMLSRSSNASSWANGTGGMESAGGNESAGICGNEQLLTGHAGETTQCEAGAPVLPVTP